jgi:tetratricopeptide (TPR) repeat protein
MAWGQALEQGKRAFDAGDYGAAARLFEQAHESSPRCDILFFLGLARYRLHQVDTALIAFQSAVQCEPRLVSAHLAMAEAYAEKGNRDEALAAFHKVLGLNPKDSSALRGAASIYLELEHAAEAVPLLEMLVQVEPRDPQVHAELAAAYFGSGNMDSAERQYREALRLQADQPSALLGLAYIYVRRGEETNAVPLLQKAVLAVPREYRPHFLLGSAYNHLEHFREAAAEFETAIRLGSDDAEVYYQLARAYGRLDRPEDRRQALARFAELTRKSGQDIESQRKAIKLVAEAKSLVDSGDLRAAAARLEEARVLRPSDDKILFRLAGLHLDLKQFDMARSYAQEAISLAPSEWLYRYLLGLVERDLKHSPQARVSFELALKLNPKAAEVHDALGDLFLEENDVKQALACFERAAGLDPQEPAYRDHAAAARKMQHSRQQ